jgi:hypothetical protein
MLISFTHREISVLTNELPEESDHFRFLRTACLANLKGTIVLNLVKSFGYRDLHLDHPLDLSSLTFIHCLGSSVLVAPHLF